MKRTKSNTSKPKAVSNNYRKKQLTLDLSNSRSQSKENQQQHLHSVLANIQTARTNKENNKRRQLSEKILAYADKLS